MSNLSHLTGSYHKDEVEDRIEPYSGLLRVEEYAKIMEEEKRVPVQIETKGVVKAEIAKGVKKAERSFGVEYNRLKEQAKELVELAIENERVYSSDIGIIPDVGEVYHLYERRDGTRFISIVGPGLGLRAEYLGSYFLDEKRVWNRTDKKETNS